jgi:flagella basal body P-ring formation protein FlgA
VSSTLLAIAALLARSAAAHAQPARPAAKDDTPRATRALPRGYVLTAEDMTPTTPDTRHPSAGWVTKRVIAAGEPLRVPAVAPPDAIRAGQPVDVVFVDGAIRLRLTGTALNAAALGARVAVRIDARRRLEGVAVGPSTVQLR